MADSYSTVNGFIQFPVAEREANNSVVRDVTIRTPGSDGQLVRITIWPEFADVALEEGDYIAADGKVDVREVNGKNYVNINAKRVVVLATAETPSREVVGKDDTSAKAF